MLRYRYGFLIIPVIFVLAFPLTLSYIYNRFSLYALSFVILSIIYLIYKYANFITFTDEYIEWKNAFFTRKIAYSNIEKIKVTPFNLGFTQITRINLKTTTKKYLIYLGGLPYKEGIKIEELYIPKEI